MSDDRKQFIWKLCRDHRRQVRMSRDYLPYSSELESMRRDFNAHFRVQFGNYEFWCHLINALRMTKRARERAGIV